MDLLKDRLMLAMQGPPPVKPSELARACGIRQPSVNDWLNGRTKRLEGKNLLLAARCLRVNPEWLATGKGAMRQNSGSYAYKNADQIEANTNRIPLIDCDDLMKWLYNAELLTLTHIYTELELPMSAFAIKIKGNVMSPRFKEGDVAIINPEMKPAPGNFVVAVVNNEDVAFLKYRERTTDHAGNTVFELHPLNEDYPSIRSDRADIKIQGVMVEHRSYVAT